MHPHVSLPELCKAGVVKNHGADFKLRVEDIPVPKPGPDQLLIKLNVIGLCYSNIHYMLEDLPLPRMDDYGVRSPGNEGAGIVVVVGNDVIGWKVGNRAGVAPTWDTCMSCNLCSKGMECHCSDTVPTGLKVPNGRDAHGVIVTASSAAAYRVAPRMVRVGGVVVCVGMFASGTAVAGDDPMYLILNNLKVVGFLTGMRRDTADALSMAAQGLLKSMYESFSIQQLPQVVDQLQQGKVQGQCMLDFNTYT